MTHISQPLRLCIMLIALCSFHHGIAQEITLQGNVILADGQPASSVNILVQQSPKGTVTDSSGNYRLLLEKGHYALLYNYIGYQPQTQNVWVKGDTSALTLPLVVLQPTTETLDAVIIKSKPKMRLTRQQGKLTVHVKNTNFEETRNVWEGLKKVPMLRVNDQESVEILGKSAIVEINGIRTKMSGSTLENYLKSLDPEAVEKIELEPNPGAAYGSQVSAYINIVLKNGLNNYRLSLQSTNGTRQDYFNTSGVNLSLNLKKVRLYTTYNFGYTPITTESDLEKQIGNNPTQHTANLTEDVTRSHSATANLYLTLSDNDQLNLNNYFSTSNSDQSAWSNRPGVTRFFNSESRNHRFQFAQVWKHQFNDSVSLKVGAYEVFKKGEGHNFAQLNAGTPQYQELNTEIPILIGFADYENTNPWGTTSAGVRYRNISVENKNKNFRANQVFSAPYHYDEKVVSAYLQHSITTGDYSNLRLGIRSESSIIDYTFTAATTADSFSDSPRYTNLLYSAQYSWYAIENRRLYNFAFRKTLKRPNYSALNPFLELSSDGTYTSGDTRLDPQQLYSLTFYTHKGDWTLYATVGYIKDLISNTYILKHNTITQNYQNFANTYYGALGAEYNHDFFNEFWTTKIGIDAQYFYLEDDAFVMDKFTPKFNLSTHNTFNLADTWTANLDFYYRTTFQDGLFKHHNTANLSLSVRKTLGQHFIATLYADDLLKTNRTWLETTVPDFYYSAKHYPDSPTIGFTLRYTLTGKAYKEEPKNSQIDDAAINRLKS